MGNMELTGIELKEYVDALLTEREKTFDLAITEKRRIIDLEKDFLLSVIKAGDESIKSSIKEQVIQVKEQVEASRREGDLRAEASEKAILKAEAAAERRFESINEFREQLRDQTSEFIPREVANSQNREVSNRINEMTARIDKMTGFDEGTDKTKVSQRAIITVIVGVGGLLFALISVVIVIVNLYLATTH